MNYQSMHANQFNSSLGRLHYISCYENSSSVIVLLHGFAASSLSWSRLVQSLPEGTGLIAPDLLGHGGSEAPEIEYTVSNQARAVWELLESIKEKEISLFGHSYGAWIACLLAIEKAFGSLIIEDAAGLDTFTDERLAGNPDYKELLIKQALLTNPNERVVRSSVYSRKSEDQLTFDKLSRIEVPALIIWGEDDAIVPVRYAKMFNDCIKNSEMYILKNVRHTPHYTNPQEVAARILSFMQKKQDKN